MICINNIDYVLTIAVKGIITEAGIVDGYKGTKYAFAETVTMVVKTSLFHDVECPGESVDTAKIARKGQHAIVSSLCDVLILELADCATDSNAVCLKELVEERVAIRNGYLSGSLSSVALGVRRDVENEQDSVGEDEDEDVHRVSRLLSVVCMQNVICVFAISNLGRLAALANSLMFDIETTKGKVWIV